MLDDGRLPAFLGRRDAGAAVPLAALDLVVDLDDVLAGGAGDAAGVEHHARDGVVVSVGVVDDAGS